MLDDKLGVAIIENNGEFVTIGDFIKALKNAGIKKGDTVCVHSQIFSFGKSLLPKKEILNTLVLILKNAVGDEGTILMPTFSYSYCKGEVYDVEKSKSDVGILTEYFRMLPDVERTMHPIFSFAVWGKRKQEFLDLPVTSFNSDSVYGRLKECNDKLVLLGAPLGYTYYYLAEEYVQVSHRYYKDFKGITKTKEGIYESIVPYYVRKLDRRSTESERKINNYLFEKELQQSVSLGHGSITVANMHPVFDSLVKKLTENESFFLREDENVL